MRRGPAQAIVLVWALLMVAAAVASLIVSNERIDSMLGVLIAALCSVVVGAILTIRVPSNAVGPLALVAGSAWVIYQFGSAYGTAALATTDGGLPGAYLFGWLGAWIGALLPLGVSTMILCFPTGRPVGRWRTLMIGPLLGAVSTVIGGILLWGLPLPTLVDSDLVSQTPRYGLIDAGFVVGFVFAIPATLSVVARFRRAGSVERQQIKWFLAATSVFVVAYIAGVMTDDGSETAWWIISLALAAIPIAILFAVLRYRLFDIDRLISRTVGYVLVVALLVAVFFGVVTATSSLLQTQSDLAVAASTLAVAALFNPVRRRVQTRVDRRFNRSRYDAQWVTDAIAGTLRDRVDTRDVVGTWTAAVVETMQPVSVAVWVRDGG